MTPQEKNVFGKLFTKTELAKHEIELADFADIKTQLQKAQDNHNLVLDFANKVFALQQEAKRVTPKAIEMLDRIQRELLSDKTNFVTKANDLGIDVSKLPQPKNYDDAIERVLSLSNNAKKAIKDSL